MLTVHDGMVGEVAGLQCMMGWWEKWQAYSACWDSGGSGRLTVHNGMVEEVAGLECLMGWWRKWQA